MKFHDLRFGYVSLMSSLILCCGSCSIWRRPTGGQGDATAGGSLLEEPIEGTTVIGLAAAREFSATVLDNKVYPPDAAGRVFVIVTLRKSDGTKFRIVELNPNEDQTDFLGGLSVGKEYLFPKAYQDWQQSRRAR